LGIAVVAVAEFITGLAILYTGGFILLAEVLQSVGFLSGPNGILQVLLFTWAIVLVTIGLLYLAAANGLTKGKGWAWTLSVIFSTTGILAGLLIGFLGLYAGFGFMPGTQELQDEFTIIFLIVSIIDLVCLETRNVRAYFGKERACY
jgi:membrane protease YdiL (CAAX protease family)